MKKAVKAAGKKILKTVEKNRRMLACMGLYAAVQMNSAICYAKGKGDKDDKKAATATVNANDVTSGLTTLKDLMFVIIGIAGVIYLGKSVMEFASAYQQSDSSGMNSAVKGIIGGFMMASISVIVGMLLPNMQ